MTDMITSDLVRLDADLGTDKSEVIRQLAAIVAAAGRTGNPDLLVTDAMAREATSNTGLPGGIAIPHCRTAAVDVPTLAFARLSPAVDFGAKDAPADLAFLIAAPEGGDATHLKVLTMLARALVKPDFVAGLRSAATPDDAVALIQSQVDEPVAAGGAHAAAPAAAAPSGGAQASLVAVTACPTGIAHTYMAAEALEQAAAKAGVDIHVETQGSAGAKPLDPAIIAGASAVIFACDVGVRDRARFAGKPMVSSGVKRAIDDPDGMVAEALKYAAAPDSAPKVEGTPGAASAAGGGGAGESWGSRVRRVLMTGVSYMIPFVAAGGLLIALGFLLGGYDITNGFGKIASENSLWNLPNLGDLGITKTPGGSSFLAYLGGVCFTLGVTAFKLFIPAMAGYIAYAIADRPGIAPGFVMGAIVTDVPGLGLPQSGFLGAILGGVLAGIVAKWIAGWSVPAWARGLMPVLVIPLLTVLSVGFVLVAFLARPMASLKTGMENVLTDMSGGSAVVLGIVLGLMMAFDMGGPLNKAAYTFATAGLTAEALASTNAPQLKIMAAVMLAGMVPPLGLALATALRPHLFTPAERENGKAAWALGISFITEGAIPFAAADPLRVIPSIMAGSAVTGAISMAAGVTLKAPHGGIFVTFAVGHILWFFVALVAGTIVAAALVVALKTASKTDAEELVTV
ncbi:MAG: fructose-specific PTS transporter subunit EIIC [Nocardioidaceae bacterium]